MDRHTSRRDDRRDDRRDERRPRDDTRNHKPRYEQGQGRSRSPRRDRRDERRRSPPRGPPGQRGPPPRSDRDRDFPRSRDSTAGGPPQRRSDDRQPPHNNKSNDLGSNRSGVKQEKQEDTKMEGGFEDEDEDAAMKRIMGFQNFRSTKETKVPGNDKNYGVFKVKKAEYRQYMNRVGGFNRPLDAM